MISRTSWLRLASKRRNSVSGVIAELCGANCKSSRIVSPIGVPPGSRVSKWGIPERSSRAANLCTCVVFPHPSDPSNVMNGNRGMIDSETKQPNCRTRGAPQARSLCYATGMKSFWLVKQEPSSYSWSDFVLEGQTSWTGVRNYAARNNLRRMRRGDEVLFYHSGEEKAVVGIAKVMRTAYPDPTAKEGDWSTVDLAAVKPLRRSVMLREIKGNSQLKGIPLVRQSRLSVMPLAEAAFREIVRMAEQGGTAS